LHQDVVYPGAAMDGEDRFPNRSATLTLERKHNDPYP
jgi:hypothetical protein